MNGVVGADRVGADDHALHEGVRAGHHQRDVLAGARLGLVGVDHEVVRLAVVLRDEAPLHAGREARAAAAAQAGVLDQVDDRARLHAQRGVEGGVAAGALVGLERPRPLGVPVVGEDRGQRVASGVLPLGGRASRRRLRRRSSRRTRRRGSRTPPAGRPAPRRRPGCRRVLRDLPRSARGPSSRARARCSRPTSEAGPAAGPSSARSSGKPASTRSASRHVQMRGPRVERTSLPSRRSSTSCVADSGSGCP